MPFFNWNALLSTTFELELKSVVSTFKEAETRFFNYILFGLCHRNGSLYHIMEKTMGDP